MMKWTGTYKPKVVNGPYKANNKKMRRVLTVTLLLLLVCVIIGILCIRHAVSSQDPDVYVVQEGDTLWGIVKKIYGERHDARELVYRTMQINNIKDPGRLQPGMKLYLPVIVD